MPTKILAIDDSKTMRLAIKITFAAEDTDVTSVSKGSEAVARAKQMGADVVVVDAVLAPGEPSGYDVCRALKQDPATARIPVILLVSNQTGPDHAELKAAGGDDWLAKPFDTQELIDKVAAVRSQVGVRPAAAAAAPPPRVAAAQEADASQSSSKRLRPQNRTQMGMPTPAAAAVSTPAAAPPAPAVAPAAVAPAAVAPAAVGPRRPVAKPSISPASLASKPAAAPRTPAKPAVSPTPAPPRSSGAGLARPAPTGGPIPIAIPIPFTSAAAPTAGMIERLQQAAAAGDVDPKVAEVIASLSREVIEAIAWEVVPYLAESIIRERAESA